MLRAARAQFYFSDYDWLEECHEHNALLGGVSPVSGYSSAELDQLRPRPTPSPSSRRCSPSSAREGLADRQVAEAFPASFRRLR